MKSTLGDITFNILYGPQSLTHDKRPVYAEHAIIESKPRLQRIGSELDEIKITVNFNIAYCRPEQEMDRLNRHRDEGNILPFVLDYGKVLGNFLITSTSEAYNKTFSDGTLIDSKVDITLREYFSQDEAEEERQAAREAGIANSQNQPLEVSNPVPATTGYANIGNGISDISADATGISEKGDKINGGIFSNIDWEEMASYLDSARATLNLISQEAAKIADFFTRFPDLALSIDDLEDSVNTLATVVSNKDTAGLPSALNQFKQDYDNVKTQFAAVVAVIEGRNY